MIYAAALFVIAVAAPQSPPTPATFTLSGRVVDVRGEGIPAATIEIGGRVPGNAIMRTRCDGEGQFRIAGLHRERTFRLHASAPGFCRVSEPIPYNRTTMEVVLPEAANLRGTVRNKAGRAVPNVAVFATGTSAVRRVVANTTTDANGQFVLAGVPLALSVVAAWIPEEGFVMASLRVTRDAAVELSPATTDLTSLSVAVTGVADEDLPKVTLRITSDELGGQPEHPEPICISSMKSAKWSVTNLPDWRFLIWPEADGIKFQPSIITVEAATGPHALTFAAHQPTAAPMTMRARVCDRDGKGIPNLRMTIYSQSSPFVRVMTDSEGMFVASLHQDPGAVASIYVNDERWLLLRTDSWESGSESARKPITADEVVALKAVRSCSVTGRLLLPDGKPASYVEVELQRNRGDAKRSRWGAVAFATTDGDGKFECRGLGNTEAQVRLFVMSRVGSAVHPYVHKTKVSGTVVLGEITLIEPATVEGLVRFGDGTLAIGYGVELRQVDPEQEGDGYLRLVMTDSQGRYRFLGVPPCAARLRVLHDASQLLPQPFVVAAGTTHDVDLSVRDN